MRIFFLLFEDVLRIPIELVVCWALLWLVREIPAVCLRMLHSHEVE